MLGSPTRVRRSGWIDAGHRSARAFGRGDPRLVLPDPYVAGPVGNVLLEFRRLLAPAGMLVLGFFDSDDAVAAFDHKVVRAYRWPADALTEQLAEAGFTQVHRLRQQLADRPDRKYAAIAARPDRKYAAIAARTT